MYYVTILLSINPPKLTSSRCRPAFLYMIILNFSSVSVTRDLELIFYKAMICLIIYFLFLVLVLVASVSWPITYIIRNGIDQTTAYSTPYSYSDYRNANPFNFPTSQPKLL
jgi:hypothetical protein